MNHSALLAALAAMQRLDGVAGLLLFKGKNAIHKQMPFTEGRTLDLMATLSEMLEGYWQVRRRIRSVYFQFDSGNLLVLIQEQAALVFFLMNRADVDLVSGAGAGLLADFAAFLAGQSNEVSASATAPGAVEELVVTRSRSVEAIATKNEPVVNDWAAVRSLVERTLGKVMGRAQAANLITRTIAEVGIDDPYRLTQAKVRQLAADCIRQVPNAAKRRQLLTELEQDLNDQRL